MTALATRIAPGIARAQLLLAALALVFMGCVTALDVVLKYTLNRPIIGAFDLVESLLPVVVFHGLPTALLRRQNIVIDLADHFVGSRTTRLLIGISDAVAVGMLGLIIAAMIAPTLQAMDYGDRKLELGLPLYVIWAAAILGMIGSAFAALTVLLQSRENRLA